MEEITNCDADIISLQVNEETRWTLANFDFAENETNRRAIRAGKRERLHDGDDVGEQLNETPCHKVLSTGVSLIHQNRPQLIS